MHGKSVIKTNARDDFINMNFGITRISDNSDTIYQWKFQIQELRMPGCIFIGITASKKMNPKIHLVIASRSQTFVKNK